MTTLTHRHPTTETGKAAGSLQAGSALMALAGLAIIGYAVISFIRDFTDSFLELGIGQAQVDVGKTQIRAFSPELYDYISHLHIAVSGFIAATGLAVAALAWFGVRHGHLWAWVTAVAAPVLASPSHCPPTTPSTSTRSDSGLSSSSFR
ncbi:hypothetical protein ACF07V_06535 [Streptomyces sp. NPDC015661]|uniref:hypothetical protein n=1 Tax=Streptomyces sp. NPDC015661 TaxID=3364961 RepID=UPI0036FAD87F